MRWIICIMYSVIVTVLSLLPSSDMPLIPIPHFDKIGHFGLYALYAMILVWTFRIKTSNLRFLIGVGLFCAGYGVTMEFFQYFLRHGDRSFEVGDIVANTLGSIAGLVFMRWHSRQEIVAEQTPADAGK